MDRTERIGINEIASLLTAKNEQITKEEATHFLKEWIAVIFDSLAIEKQVEVTGFGTFSLSQIKEKETAAQIESRNEQVTCYYRIGFTPHETLRKSVNIFFSNFEPSLLNEGVTFDTLPEVIAGETGEEEYIFNHIQVNVPSSKQQIPATTTEEAELKTAGFIAAEIPVEGITTEESITELKAEKENQTKEIPERDHQEAVEQTPESASYPETVASEIPVNTIEPEESIEPVPPLSNILSESLRHLSPEPHISHGMTHREIGRRHGSRHPVWLPILGGMAIIVAALFFFRETHGKSGSDPF